MLEENKDSIEYWDHYDGYENDEMLFVDYLKELKIPLLEMK